jgi:hypothetical protein
MNGSTSPMPASLTDFIVQMPNGYEGQIEQNAVNPTANNYVLRIFAGGSGNAAPVELATGAYPAALTTEVILIKVRVKKRYD